MTDINKTGFVALYVSANKLTEFGFKFGVVLEDNKVKAYVVDKETWHKIENNFNESGTEWNDTSYVPLVIMTDGFMDTAKQMGWVIVGA